MFHVKHQDWLEASRSLGIELPSEAPRQLDAFESLLRDRAIQLGLVAPGDEQALRARHILDSLRAAPLIGDTPRNGIVVDIGSGAGLPGVPLAIARPALRFVLAERRGSRAAFLEFVVDELALPNVVIHAGRAELMTAGADICLARAFGDIHRSWSVASQLLQPSGSLLYWAGRRWRPPLESPPGTTLQVAAAPGLANTGPIVIMSRQW
jgi:16S rRNA (guanine527-N7)-methyltransferase